MKSVWALLLVGSCAPAYAEVSLKWNPVTQGLYVNGGVGPIDLNIAPQDPVVPAPYEFTISPSDTQLALQVISIALTMGDTGVSYTWESESTGDYGRVDLYGQIDGLSEGCVGYSQTVFVQGKDYEEFFTACAGGGNSNTWIVNNKWIVNSVDRNRFDNGCRVRFSDVRLDRDRVESTLMVCFIPGVNMWKVRG